MRTFGGSFVLTKQAGGEDSAEVLAAVVDAWHEARVRDPKLAGKNLQRTDSEDLIEGRRLRRWQFTEEVASGDGHWTTLIRVLEDGEAPGAAFVSIEMAWDDMADRLAPIHVPVGPPRFLSQLHGRCEVKTIDGYEATLKPFEVQDSERLRLLVSEILDPQRKLPLVVVTDPVYTPPLAPGLSEKLARRMYGLGRVMHLSSRMARSLSLALGKELSVFDGGIRVYWPGATSTDSPRKHPLLLRTTMSNWGSPKAVELEILGRVPGLLIKAATQRYRPPAPIEAFERRVQQERISGAAHSLEDLQSELAKAREALSEAKDLEALALADNQDKQRDLHVLEEELRAAKEALHVEREKNNALRIALEEAGRGVAAPPPEPSSAEEAIEIARRTLAETLELPANIVVDTDLGPDLYDVLKAMGEACEAERRGTPRNRELFHAVLTKHLEHPGKYKPGPTGTFYSVDGRNIEVRDRVHLRSTRPVETESIYFLPIGEPTTRRYLITRVGRHV